VVESVVDAVDVGYPSASARSLTITYPALGEADHPSTIGIHAVAEVEILHLDLVNTGCYGSNDVLVLADGSKGGIILDPAQST
jgi:hypothetical protein